MLEKLLRLSRPAPRPAEELPGLFSQEALQRAWARVRANRGAAGVDGVTIRTFERDLARHLSELQRELVEGTYRPLPVRQVFVPKRQGGARPLAIWTLRDRVVQRAMHDSLEPLFEPLFLDCSFGFRPNRSVADAVARVTEHRDAHRRWVVDADIEDCFGHIDPGILMRLVRRRVRHRQVLRLIHAWLRAHVFNTMDGRSAFAGVSQGNVLAPLLCNIYLHEFDQALARDGYHLVRYADDLVILCRRKAEAQEGLNAAGQALRRLRLTLHPEKTQLTHFNAGFTFLGHFFLRNEVFRV